MLKALKKYDPSYKGGIPDFGLIGSYISADLAIKGLSVGGKNPTPSSVVTNLRKVASYNAGGILPSSVTFRGFATLASLPQTTCGYYEQLVNDHYVLYKGKALCGQRIVYNNPAG